MFYFRAFYCNGTIPFLPIHSCEYGLGNFFFTEWAAIYYYSFILKLKIFPDWPGAASPSWLSCPSVMSYHSLRDSLLSSAIRYANLISYLSYPNSGNQPFLQRCSDSIYGECYSETALVVLLLVYHCKPSTLNEKIENQEKISKTWVAKQCKCEKQFINSRITRFHRRKISLGNKHLFYRQENQDLVIVGMLNMVKE